VLEIRAVGAAEAAPLRALRLRALADAPGAFAVAADEEAGRPESDWEDLIHESLRAEDVVVYAAVDGERWLGMAAGRWYDREQGIAHLWGMWVDPEVRRGGVGAQLVDSVLRWVAASGGRFLRLGVIAAERDATPFYERLGFVATGEEAPLRRDPTRLVRYLIRSA
jgi:ribosomal protein S18 acetylase RimI-like enzyme